MTENTSPSLTIGHARGKDAEPLVPAAEQTVGVVVGETVPKLTFVHSLCVLVVRFCWICDTVWSGGGGGRERGLPSIFFFYLEITTVSLYITSLTSFLLVSFSLSTKMSFY